MRFYVGQCDVQIFNMPTQRVLFAGPRNNVNLVTFDPVCKGPYEILVFLTKFFFLRRNEIISWGEKRTALFQTHNWEKSSFFQHTCTCICTVIHKYVIEGAQCAPCRS